MLYIQVYEFLCVVSAVRPAQVEITEGQQMCAICSDVGNGIHFGVITCEGCKVRSLELLLFEDEFTMCVCHYLT